MRVTLLGTGTSRGVPVIGCSCGVCTSTNPKNRRLRCSVLIEGRGAVVIDTSTDFRAQMLRHRVRKLDAVLFTHHHADHILGLDDVYPFNIWSRKPLPVHGAPTTLKELKITFRYLFEPRPYPGVPKIQLIPIDGPFEVAGMKFDPIPVFHGALPVLGFRTGPFAYLTDVSRIPERSMAKLEGVQILVLDGLRYRKHPTHFSLAEAAEVAASLGAQRTFLVHMCHDVEHDEGNAYLPDSVSLGFDGLVLEIDQDGIVEKESGP